MEKHSELGNQQERHQADLHWLGGLFDGEGSVSLLATCKNRHTHIGAQMRLVATEASVMQEVCRILTNCGLAHHVSHHKPSKLSNRPTQHLVISGLKRVKTALDYLLPYMRFKSEAGRIALEFCNVRLSRGRRAPYSDEEIEMVVALRVLHGYRLRESPETIRETLKQRRYSPNSVRKTEKAAEMTASLS